jgi:hypothetical protein
LDYFAAGLVAKSNTPPPHNDSGIPPAGEWKIVAAGAIGRPNATFSILHLPLSIFDSPDGGASAVAIFRVNGTDKRYRRNEREQDQH